MRHPKPRPNRSDRSAPNGGSPPRHKRPVLSRPARTQRFVARSPNRSPSSGRSPCEPSLRAPTRLHQQFHGAVPHKRPARHHAASQCVHHVLERLAGGELHSIRGRDGNLRARRRITSRAGSALPLRKRAETDQLYRFAATHRVRDRVQDRLDGFARVGFADARARCDRVNEFLLVHEQPRQPSQSCTLPHPAARTQIAGPRPTTACCGQPTNELRLTPVAATLGKSNRERFPPGQRSHNQRAGAGVITGANYVVRLPVSHNLTIAPAESARPTCADYGIGSCRVSCLPSTRHRQPGLGSTLVV
ncbi:hypothetical protein BCEP27_30037 [Burkholderia cepacia]